MFGIGSSFFGLYVTNSIELAFLPNLYLAFVACLTLHYPKVWFKGESFLLACVTISKRNERNFDLSMVYG